MGPDPKPPVIRGGDPRTTPAPLVVAEGHEGDNGGNEATESPAPAVPPSRVLTLVAFLIVLVPFAVIAIRLLFESTGTIALPDDLALIDLHTRDALHWQQQLGVFDRFNWNHPGPTYFYLLSVSYRLFGTGVRAMVVGATVLNGLAATGCLAVVRRRSTPTRTLWAAVWLCLLGILLAVVSPGALTYSEGALGGLVSPWNPMVIIVPLVLFVLLCAATIDRSWLSFVAALIVGSFIVQTNISALPLVASLLVVSGVWFAAAAFRQRRTSRPEQATETRVSVSGHAWAWGAAGLVVLIVMWLPPLIQQLTGTPGNLGLIYRFFTAGHPGQTWSVGVWSVVAAFAVLVSGPGEVMNSVLGGHPAHAALAVGVTVLALLVAGGLLVVGLRQRRRFAAGIGVLVLVAFFALLVSVTRIIGPIYGYLVVWAVALPIAALIGLGMVDVPLGRRMQAKVPTGVRSPVRIGLCAIGLLASIVFVVNVVRIPQLDTLSDPQVAQLTSLVTPTLAAHGTVLVGDDGAGRGGSQLLDVERFIGLVNALDAHGYQPKVNDFWRVQFGPRYLSQGGEDRTVSLSNWSPQSPERTGYVGRVGDMAVTVTTKNGSPSPG